MFYNGTYYENEGYKVNVADTVGAGDAFLGTLLSVLIPQTPQLQLQYAIDKACAVGALVASKKGATPHITNEAITALLET